MKITYKQILAAIGAVLTIVAAVYGMTEYFTPREVAELWISDLQKNQIMIQRNFSIQQAQNWYYFYQAEVERLTGEVASDPGNRMKRNQLNMMKARRDEAKRRWDSLMRQ